MILEGIKTETQFLKNERLYYFGNIYISEERNNASPVAETTF